MSDRTPLITWVSDSASRESIHRNVPNLTLKDSELGYIIAKRDVDGDKAWGYVLNGTYHMARGYADARQKLEASALASLPASDTTPCGTCSHVEHVGKCNRAMNCECVK